jgi:hypothetical protein
MMPNQKEEAEILRHGLLADVRTVADAVAWADGIIAADPKPDIAVMEVASSARRHTAEVVTLLRDVPGECNPVAVIRHAMVDLRTALAAEPARGLGIARWLYQLATSGELPEEDFGQEAYSLEDWFYLASSGTYGTSADALRNLDAYLERHAWRHEV